MDNHILLSITTIWMKVIIHKTQWMIYAFMYECDLEHIDMKYHDWTMDLCLNEQSYVFSQGAHKQTQILECKKRMNNGVSCF